MKNKKLNILLAALITGSAFGILSGFLSPKAEESYRVINVQGVIKDLTQQQVLRRGMDVYEKDELVFTNTTDKAIVISSKKGRFVLAPQLDETDEKRESEIQTFLFSVLLPIKKNRELDFRSMGDVIYDLSHYFDKERFHIIGDRLDIKVHPAKYPDKENEFFVFRYIYQGKPINKKILLRNQDHLILDKQELFISEAGNIIPMEEVEEMSLYWLNNYQGKTTANIVANLNLIFQDANELKADLEEVIKIEKSLIPLGEKRYKYLAEFFTDAYGPTDLEIFKDWLKKEGF